MLSDEEHVLARRPQPTARWRDRMAEFADAGVEALYRAVEPELEWLEIPYGNVLVFTHTLMHGNRVNVEPTTRWSINIRFKGLFTPYSDKQLGDFFDPISAAAGHRASASATACRRDSIREARLPRLHREPAGARRRLSAARAEPGRARLCAAARLPFLLSVAEYAMPNCYMMLDTAVAELPQLDGIIVFSAFMLPERPNARRALYDRVLAAGATLHAALESRVVADRADAEALEELLLVAQALHRVPFGGRYEKDGRPPNVATPTDAALLASVLPD